VNGLHWGWQGGYVFLALEGDWRIEEESVIRGYSFHIANDPQRMSVELPLKATLDGDQVLRLALDAGDIFDGCHRIELTEMLNSTHGRTNDTLVGQLRENIERAFRVEGFVPGRPRALNASVPRALISSNAVPYPFTMSRFFPRPALPLDNPLTEQGVELGRFLFQEERLSINGSQSCASCHDLNAAGADPGRVVSRGAEGRTGTRNAMSLFNLAWKDSFFWDGQAKTLREQVLMPIQNRSEMHETLASVVAKLRGDKGSNDAVGPHISYPWLFKEAFGSLEINADRVARALEQFLLVQVSHHARFDRVLNGELTFTEQEQRGFELFHTEYDPRRGLYGADCFHCHGGPIFQNVSFANNGLDAESKDLGRFQVTGREGDKGKFAVPSLRNVAVTGPYMHDGRFKRLEEVVEHYNSGIKRSLTLDPNLSRHPERGLNLSLSDKRALVAFLKTLTDERFVTERRPQLP
jgi:cytochrome c peroxidase